MDNRFVSSLYIIGGILLFMFAAGDLLYKLFFMLMALSLINTGLRMQGMPSLHLLVRLWFDEMRWW